MSDEREEERVRADDVHVGDVLSYSGRWVDVLNRAEGRTYARDSSVLLTLSGEDIPERVCSYFASEIVNVRREARDD